MRVFGINKEEQFKNHNCGELHAKSPQGEENSFIEEKGKLGEL